jgi:hypothetical protein
MTLELVSEQKLDDEVPSYYIYLDGLYVAGSYTKDLDTAHKYYERIYNNPAIVNNAKKVLKSEEIVVSLKDTKTQ